MPDRGNLGNLLPMWQVSRRAVMLAAAGWAAWPLFPDEAYDLTLTNGLIIDGTGRPGFRADLGIRHGRIAKIGSLESASATARLDAHGLVVSPGFMDVHVHIEDPIKLSTRRLVADNFLLQGVTTVITGNCGRSAPNIAALFAKLGRLKLALNVATLVGHNTLRQQVCGARPVPAPRELQRLEDLVGEGIRAGALGFSTGLCYKPGLFAHEDEVAALVRVAAKEHAIYATHLRDEGADEPAALAEGVRTVARAGEVRLHISHVKAAGRSQWGTARARLEEARKSAGPGVCVTSDMYPYTAISSTLEYLVPAEAFTLLRGPEASFSRAVDLTLARLRRDSWPDFSNVRVAFSEKHKEWIGKTIPEIVGKAPSGDASVREEATWVVRNAERGGVQIIAEEMSEQDVRQLVSAPGMVFGSDSSIHYRGLGRPHPRGAGTFPRIFAQYVRAQKLLTLQDAVHRATGLAAEIFALPDRGLIREGYWADLAIFDPQLIEDRATFDDPWKPPEGIFAVIVNGRIAVREGRVTGALAGQPVCRAARP